MLTPFFDVAGLVANRQKILLSRWLHSKFISSLKSLSNWKTMFWVIPQEQDSIKTLEFAGTNSYFYSFTYQKNIYLAVSSSDQWVDFFCKFAGRQKSCWFNTKILSACLKHKPGLCFFSLHKMQMNKEHRLIN